MISSSSKVVSMNRMTAIQRSLHNSNWTHQYNNTTITSKRPPIPFCALVTAARITSIRQQQQQEKEQKRTLSSSSSSSSSVTNVNNNNNNNSGTTQSWDDPCRKQYKYWNRENDTLTTGKYKYLLEISPESIQREAKIISLSSIDDDANISLHSSLLVNNSTANTNTNNTNTTKDNQLPLGSTLLQIGTTLSDFDTIPISDKPNVLYVSPSCPNASIIVPQIIEKYNTSLQWIHVRSAGIDFIVSDELTTISKKYPNIIVTNAKGQFSSSLAEYALMACSYFAKNIPRLIQQKHNKQWIPYPIQELRGKTMGIIGYGDIGRAVAKLATVYGMKVIALRRHPYLSKDDPYCNVVYGRDKHSLNLLMSQSDYIVCSTPSTIETRGMVNSTAFNNCKQDSVFINLGRGPVIDEDALIQCLQSGTLKGAALDVFEQEPLPISNQLWDIPNVLLSPHNMDQTNTFMHEATEFFIRENLPRFICGEDLLNPVDPILGY